MSSNARKNEVERYVQGVMALAAFGCHCGDTWWQHRLTGHWLLTHLRNKHPELYLSAEKHHITYEVGGVNLTQLVK